MKTKPAAYCGMCGRKLRERPSGAAYCRFEGASYDALGTFRGDARDWAARRRAAVSFAPERT